MSLDYIEDGSIVEVTFLLIPETCNTISRQSAYSYDSPRTVTFVLCNPTPSHNDVIRALRQINTGYYIFDGDDFKYTVRPYIKIVPRPI